MSWRLRLSVEKFFQAKGVGKTSTRTRTRTRRKSNPAHRAAG
jgi:hypothetical protein